MFLVDSVSARVSTTMDELIGDWNIFISGLNVESVQGHESVTRCVNDGEACFSSADRASSPEDVVQRDDMITWCDDVARLLNIMIAQHDMSQFPVFEQFSTAYVMRLRDFQHSLLV